MPVTESTPVHEPVLVEEILRLCDPRPGQVVVDGTVGLGGHARAILPRILPDGRYIGLDLDEAMLSASRAALAAFGPAVELVRANYADFAAVLSTLGVSLVDLVLLDLGVNSAQLADGQRGFSFDREGPLDMRFDTSQRQQAADLINSLSEGELADLFYHYAQETQSRKIAKRICQMRHHARIATTRALAAVVESAVGAAGLDSRRRGIHPATRVFQALRIAVNHELENLERVLPAMAQRLRPGGRLAVISFHSLEDGIVKRSFRESQKRGWMLDVTKRPVVAEARERDRNPRSRSAKLRVAQRVEDAHVP